MRISESDLYDPIVATIASHWVPDHRIQDFVIDCTARQGSRDTGGMWTRPDVALASCSRLKFVPGIQLELNTFEIKTFDGLDVTSVYEALAHRRAAHYSYVVAYIPESKRRPLKSLVDRLCLDSESHGIGLRHFVPAADGANALPRLVVGLRDFQQLPVFAAAFDVVLASVAHHRQVAICHLADDFAGGAHHD